MFLCRNKKNNIYPCKPQFYYLIGLILKRAQLATREARRERSELYAREYDQSKVTYNDIYYR